MKKKTLSILSLCIALFAAFALVGCGGSASSGGGGSSASKSEGKEKAPVAKKTDFIWFKVEMPEGVGVSDSAGKNADRVQLTFPEDENGSADRFIPVWKKALTQRNPTPTRQKRKVIRSSGRMAGPSSITAGRGSSERTRTTAASQPSSLPTLSREASTFSSRTSICIRKKPRRSSTPSSFPMTWRRQLPRHAKSRFRASRSSIRGPHAASHAQSLNDRTPSQGRIGSAGPPLFYARAYCHLSAQIRPPEWDTWPT